jgi:hypothetical protein
MESVLYYIAAFLTFMIGIAHSYLGEKYILTRLFRVDNLPKIFGGTQFTKSTLRFAWHLTTVAWFGFAFLLIYLALGKITMQTVGNTIATVFMVHCLIALISSKAKHLSWLVFLGISLSCLYATNT